MPPLPADSHGDLSGLSAISRRDFVRASSLGLAALGLASSAALRSGSSLLAAPAEQAAVKKAASPETLVQKLYASLTPAQKSEICFPWDYQDDRGVLRTHVSNNWHITAEQFNVGGPFFSSDQQELIREIFLGLYNKDWHARILKQLQDDASGYGKHQTIALFGTPGSGKFEFVMTGRHLTIRCDGDSTEHVAFGGPIFYGHAAAGFNEAADHPGNVFWPQAQQANALYKMLDGKQRERALALTAPRESAVAFRKQTREIPGLPVSEMSADQKAHAQKVLQALVEPYRQPDQQEALRALKTQGGLDACRLIYYRQGADGKSVDLGDDGVWDVWRLEGPAFVWHFRGAPHVHVWVNVADDPSVKLNARG